MDLYPFLSLITKPIVSALKNASKKLILFGDAVSVTQILSNKLCLIKTQEYLWLFRWNLTILRALCVKCYEWLVIFITWIMTNHVFLLPVYDVLDNRNFSAQKFVMNVLVFLMFSAACVATNLIKMPLKFFHMETKSINQSMQ